MTTVIGSSHKYAVGMGEVARPGLKLAGNVEMLRLIYVGMGEVARPGLKLPCKGPGHEVASGVEWERWPVRV